jgi:hypothetical protein
MVHPPAAIWLVPIDHNEALRGSGARISKYWTELKAASVVYSVSATAAPELEMTTLVPLIVFVAIYYLFPPRIQNAAVSDRIKRGRAAGQCRRIPFGTLYGAVLAGWQLNASICNSIVTGLPYLVELRPGRVHVCGNHALRNASPHRSVSA